MEKIKELYKLVLKKYIIKEAVAASLIMMTTLLSMLKPLVTSGIIDQALEKKDFAALKIYILFFIIVFFISELLRLIQSTFNIYVAQNMTNDMQFCFFRSFTRRSVLAVDGTAGDLITRIVSEIPKITEFITNTLPVFMMNIFTLVIGLIMMFVLNKEITLYCIFFLPLIFVINKYYSPKIKEKAEENLKDIAKSTNTVEQTIKNLYLIKYFRKYTYIDNLYMDSLKKVKNSRFSIYKLNLHLTLSLTITTFFPHLIVMILSCIKVIQGEMSIGEMVALSNYIGYIISPVLFFSQTTIGWQQIKVIINRFLEYTMQKDLIGNKDLKKVEGKRIEVKNVDFEYPNKTILKQFNFQAQRGDKIRIQGKNGAGKTTFVNLVTNLLTVSAGNIFIDGESIENIDFSNMIGISMQRNSFFDDTVRNNIRLGRNIPDSVILEYAKKLGFYKLFDNELSLDSVVYSQGSNISGGQAQKINILRAIVGECPIIILDEFASFLDVDSKKNVQKFINTLQNTIVFIISHEKESIIQYTKVLEIDNH